MNTVSYFSELRSTCYHSAVAIMFLLSLHTLKYLLPQCCFNMVCDCPCRPTSASQVYIYIHMSMGFITVSMHLQVIGATVLCQSDFLSLLPQSCVNKVDYCTCKSSLTQFCHCYHEIGEYMATKKSAKIWQNNCHQLFVEGIILNGVTVVDDK